MKPGTFYLSAHIRIGNRVAISGSTITARSRIVEIGDDTIIAANCAIFEHDRPFPVTRVERRDIDMDDEDFLRACELHGITPT